MNSILGEEALPVITTCAVMPLAGVSARKSSVGSRSPAKPIWPRVKLRRLPITVIELRPERRSKAPTGWGAAEVPVILIRPPASAVMPMPRMKMRLSA